MSAALLMGATIPITLAAVQAHPAGASGDVIAAAGSDTTVDVMDQLLAGTGAVNVHVPKNQTAAGQTVPGDSFCNSVTYNDGTAGTDGNGNPLVVAPKNSGEGRTALQGSVAKTYPNTVSYTNPTSITSLTGGCIDIARSSSKSSLANQENYAFGLDAVSWGTTSLNAPANLTLQQLQDIWNCKYNDWSQVGGSPGPIQRVLPKFGSGTRKFFINNVLQNSTETDSVGATFPTTGTLTGTSTAITCPAVIGDGTTGGVEENSGNEFTTSATRQQYQQYIFPYSSGKWVFQATGAGNPSIDVRNGVRPGGLIGVASTGSFPAAYTVRWTGTAWRLNDAQILGTNATGARSQAGVNAAAQFATSLTGGPGTFLAGDVGKQVQGTGINDGTTITAVAADGSSATIAPGAKAAISGGTVIVGYAVVSEKNPGVLTSSNLEYPGVRYIYNVLQTNAPSYTTARSIVGFDDTSTTGVVSNICNGSDAGIISSNGFLALPALLPSTNATAVTCRKL